MNKQQSTGHHDYSHEISNFRNNLLGQLESMELNTWISYCNEIELNLEKEATQLNNQLRGELAEVILEVLLKDVQSCLKKSGIKSVIFKNMGLVEKRENGLYSTELDLVFMTEYRCYLFEVKSYSGDKVLTDECMLHGKRDIDIYSQSRLHLDLFKGWFESCRIKHINRGTGLGRLPSPYKLIFFEYSSGAVEDKRDETWRKIIPYLDVSKFHAFWNNEIKALSEQSAALQWDINKSVGTMKKLDSSRQKILDYHVSRLNNKNIGGYNGTKKSKS